MQSDEMIPSKTRRKPPMYAIGTATFLFLILSAVNVWAKPLQDTSLRWTVPTFTPTATPRTGGLCVEVYHDRNRDGVRQAAAEELLGGAVVRVAQAGASQVVATVTTSGGSPACIQALEPALYVVREQNPPGYISTTDDVWGAVISSNVTIAIPFGDVYAPGTPRAYLPLIMRHAQGGE